MKRARFERLLRNTPFGVLVGFISALIISLSIDQSISDDLKKLYTFLVTACLSLLAASLTLIGVFANIENQTIVAEAARRRKLNAARAFLPTAISSVCSLCSNGIDFSRNFKYYFEENKSIFEKESIEALTLSDETIYVLRDIIELSDNEDISRRITGLLTEHQIFLSRWRSLFSKDAKYMINHKDEDKHKTVSWAYLYAIATSLFDYARGENDELGAVGEKEIRSALHIAAGLFIDGEDYAMEIRLYAQTFESRAWFSKGSSQGAR